MVICNTCNVKIIEGEEVSYCAKCQKVMHNVCSEGFCLCCSVDIFPFNNVVCDRSFNECLQLQFYQPVPPVHLDNIIFNTSELNAINEMIITDEIDPDVNYLNNINKNNINSKYYTEEEFNNTLLEPNKSQLFSLFHLNIRSIQKNILEFSSYLENLNHEFSIIGLTETWISDSSASLFNLTGYLQRENYRKDKRGGGVSLYIKNNLDFIERNDITIMNNFIETLFIEIKKEHTSKNIIVGVIYKPPTSPSDAFLDILNNILLKLQNEHKTIYIMGDFNINLLRGTQHKATSDFVDTMFSYSLLPVINKPTRITNSSASLIDNIFSNSISDSNLLNGILCTGISDHLPIFCIDMDSGTDKEVQYIKKRLFTEANKSKFIECLNAIDWNSIILIENCQEAFTKFHEKIIWCFNESFPYVYVKLGYRNRKPWLTAGMKHSIKVKNKLYVLSLKRSTLVNIKRYKDYNRTLQKILRQAERKHYNDLLQENIGNVRKSWEIIREIINVSKKKSQLKNKLKVNDRIVSDSKLIANGFNEYFANIGLKLNESSLPSDKDPSAYMPPANPNSIFLLPVDCNEVERIIKDFKNKSPGWDDIPSSIIAQTYPLFIETLTHLINLSFSQGIFPDELKIAKVIPLFKGGDDELMNNYRPVSILSIFSKIFERLMHNRLMSFIDANNLLYKYQFGFRKAHGTDLALITLVDKISSALDSGNYVLGVFLDLSKAFDTVDHNILLSKMHLYGIRGIAHNWFKSYLDSRSQYVVFNDAKSDTSYIRCGVPQGSILGPLLFLLYVNDLVNISANILPILFADDTNLFLVGTDLDQLITSMNNELKLLIEWINTNKLVLNVSKTNYMIFCTRGKSVATNLNVCINREKLKKVEYTKFLGVFIDDKLSWKQHINIIKTKVAKSIGILCKARKTLNVATLITLYNSFIYPYFTYGIEVWGSAGNSFLDSISKLQKRCIRIITSSGYRAHSEPLFKRLNILPLSKMYSYCIVKLMYKFRKHQVPTALNSMFETREQIHPYRTRQRTQLHLPAGRTTLVHRSFKYRGVQLWNEFSIRVDHQCSLQAFKFKLKRYLLDN